MFRLPEVYDWPDDVRDYPTLEYHVEDQARPNDAMSHIIEYYKKKCGDLSVAKQVYGTATRYVPL